MNEETKEAAVAALKTIQEHYDDYPMGQPKEMLSVVLATCHDLLERFPDVRVAHTIIFLNMHIMTLLMNGDFMELQKIISLANHYHIRMQDELTSQNQG